MLSDFCLKEIMGFLMARHFRRLDDYITVNEAIRFHSRISKQWHSAIHNVNICKYFVRDFTDEFSECHIIYISYTVGRTTQYVIFKRIL